MKPLTQFPSAVLHPTKNRVNRRLYSVEARNGCKIVQDFNAQSFLWRCCNKNSFGKGREARVSGVSTESQKKGLFISLQQ